MRIVFEGILMLIMFASAIFFIGIPLSKIIKLMLPTKTDPLVEAKVRLEVAQKEIEAARLNKETEKIYSSLYEEVLQDDIESDRKKI